MIRRPSHRGISLIATSSLLALMLLVPAGASAATPSLIPDSFGAPSTVSNGGRGAVALTIYNNDKSTVSQLFLINIAVQGGVFVTAYPSQGTCTGNSCTLGQLKPKKTATVYVVFDADTIDFSQVASAQVDVTGLWNTTGIAGTGDNSHGDAWDGAGSATIFSGAAQDFAGRFIDDAGNLIVENTQAVSDTNPQATKVVAPKGLIGVSVEDGTNGNQTCDPTKVACSKLFGEDSIVDVANGGTFPGGFQIIVTFDGSEIVGANQNTLQIYHTFAGGYEVISTKCSFAPNSPTPKSMPCLTVAKGDGKDLIATIWTTHNGVIHGLG